MIKKWSIFLLIFQTTFACSSAPKDLKSQAKETLVVQNKELPIVLGNERIEEYLKMLQNKSIGFVGNHTSLIGNTPVSYTHLTLPTTPYV